MKKITLNRGRKRMKGIIDQNVSKSNAWWLQKTSCSLSDTSRENETLFPSAEQIFSQQPPFFFTVNASFINQREMEKRRGRPIERREMRKDCYQIFISDQRRSNLLEDKKKLIFGHRKEQRSLFIFYLNRSFFFFFVSFNKSLSVGDA